jgi:Na+/H+ antiporter NhaD/arsenite permease-like protein
MGHGEGLVPNAVMIVPFGVLLAAIALAPLFFGEWWGRHYGKVALGLGAITVGYYVGMLGEAGRGRVLETAHEYMSFIVLIGALYVVSGGIHITVKGEATPRANCVFLLIGALVANLLGTTGASMLLIRPWLRLNAYRVTAHHVVFFIFIVSNVGGALTPIGDPPLFLGYLKGIPFWWVASHCWPMWLVGVGSLIVMFYFVDRHNYQRAPKAVRETLAEPPDQWRFEGLWNLAFLASILGAVFVTRPVFLREVLMAGAAVGSYFTTRREVHDANHFNFHPIQEVAILFVGIFATMLPALDWLGANAGRVGEPGPGVLFWSSGMLSSVLDNAPTYLSFLSAAQGALVEGNAIEALRQLVESSGAGLAALTGPHAEGVRAAWGVLAAHFGPALQAKAVTSDQLRLAYLLGNGTLNQAIVAVSVGAVFFGANTYIGNGPNFMVKAIADQKRVRTPTFLGYVFGFTLPFMVPMLVVVWWLFF